MLKELITNLLPNISQHSSKEKLLTLQRLDHGYHKIFVPCSNDLILGTVVHKHVLKMKK